MNLDDLRELAQLTDLLPDPNGLPQGGRLYFSGRLNVDHPDGYRLGAFVIEEDWWTFVPGEDTDG